MSRRSKMFQNMAMIQGLLAATMMPIQAGIPPEIRRYVAILKKYDMPIPRRMKERFAL